MKATSQDKINAMRKIIEVQETQLKNNKEILKRYILNTPDFKLEKIKETDIVILTDTTERYHVNTEYRFERGIIPKDGRYDYNVLSGGNGYECGELIDKDGITKTFVSKNIPRRYNHLEILNGKVIAVGNI